MTNSHTDRDVWDLYETGLIEEGDRVELLRSMENDPAPIKAGARGTVDWIGKCHQIGVRWDDGRRLMLVPGDEARLINEEGGRS